MAASLRVVLDTNVLLSGIAYPASVPGRIIGAWKRGSIEVVLSEWILDELRRVLPRLAHRHGLSSAEIDDFVDALSIQAELADTHPSVPGEPGLRDPCDLPVLATLVNGKADYLVTGDKDLLVLADTWPILTPAQFWAGHGGP